MKYLWFTILMSFSPLTLACSCAEWSMLDAVTNSRAIFIGKINRLEKMESESYVKPYNFFAKLIKVSYTVSQIVKGPIPRNGVMYTLDPSSIPCSVGFIEGQRYFIYLSDDNLVTYCGGTKHMSRILDEERRMVGDKAF